MVYGTVSLCETSRSYSDIGEDGVVLYCRLVNIHRRFDFMGPRQYRSLVHMAL